MFTWDKLLTEIASNAPVFLSILEICTQTVDLDQIEVLSLECFVILLKYRYFKMTLVQKIVSMILYAGDCSKQVSNI